jgi:RHS repeat-associated protein
MAPASGSTRWFVNSKDWQVLEEYLGTSVDRRYVWGIRYIDDLVLRDWSNGGTLNVRHFALQDANWNVVAICNTSGAVQERYVYTDYGVCQFLSNTFVAQPDGSSYDWTVLFTGRVRDDESELYYDRMRYYHPALGVFLATDAIDSVANLYGYCRGNPASMTDPYGLYPSPTYPLPPALTLPTIPTLAEILGALGGLIPWWIRIAGVAAIAAYLLAKFGYCYYRLLGCQDRMLARRPPESDLRNACVTADILECQNVTCPPNPARPNRNGLNLCEIEFNQSLCWGSFWRCVFSGLNYFEEPKFQCSNPVSCGSDRDLCGCPPPRPPAPAPVAGSGAGSECIC